VHRLLGDICAHKRRDDEEAERHHRQGRTIAQELGMRPLQARCLLSLAGLYDQLGRKGEAHEAASAAHDLCREMDMGFWCSEASTMLARIAGTTPVGSGGRFRGT
jgi:hypothetical protein